MRRALTALLLAFVVVLGTTPSASAWRWRGPIYHLSWPHYKHEENSIHGVRVAHRKHYARIDIDLTVSAEHHIFANHWAHPMLKDGFRDPLRQIDRHTSMHQMTDAQIERLVAGHRPFRRYHIHRIETILAECGRLGIVALLEPKGAPLFDHVETWTYLMKVADQVGAHIEVYALPQNASALPAARAAGIEHVWEIHPGH